VISVSAGPIINNLLDNFKYQQKIDVPQLRKESMFQFDYRITNDPVITNEYIEFFIFGELTANSKPCTLPYNNKHDFQNDKENFQIVITERSINCALLAF